MGGDEGDLGHVGFQPILNLGQIGNPGHDPKALPTPVVFAQQRLAERHTIKFRDIGADRQTVDRGRRDDRQIAHPGQRKLQRARNGRRGQRQHMDVGAQFFQPLFVRHTKVLLFVDDQKAKVLELHALGQKRMGADDDIHRPCPHHLPRQVGLFGADKTRQRSNRNREPTEAFGKAAVMLAGQKRGRADHRHLHARQSRHKGRAHRNLGLTKADIADDQTVHRAALFKVCHHIGNRRQLVIGFLIGEARGKGLPQGMWRLQDRRVAQSTLSRDPHQAVGNLFDPLFELGLLGLPSPTAQPVQQALFMAIAAEKFNVFNGQVKFRPFGIFKAHASMRCAQRRDRLQPQIAPDPMFDMHHQIAGAETFGITQEILGLALALGLGGETVAQHVLFGNDRQSRRDKTGLQGPDHQEKPALALGQVAQILDRLRPGDALILQKPRQPLSRAFRPRGDDDMALLTQRLNMICQGTEKTDAFLPSLWRKATADPGAGIQNTRAGRLGQGGKLDQPVVGHRRLPGGIV